DLVPPAEPQVAGDRREPPGEPLLGGEGVPEVFDRGVVDLAHGGDDGRPAALLADAQPALDVVELAGADGGDVLGHGCGPSWACRMRRSRLPRAISVSRAARRGAQNARKS